MFMLWNIYKWIYIMSVSKVLHKIILQADVHHPSIRDRFYAFVGLSELNRSAVDIAFGSSGYILELSRAFRKVSLASCSFMVL